jgi:tRNA (guanine37-N1)-methyltransferase
MFAIGIVALFPEIVEPVVRLGVVGRAVEAGRLGVETISPRDFTTDRHRSVDDRPYGGGPGMVMLYEPVRDAVQSLETRLPQGTRRIVMSAQGRQLDQTLAGEFASLPGLVIVAGRYEGLDERVGVGLGALEVSIGDYVLSGGELAAAVLIDAVARLLPGVVGHEDATDQDSFMRGLLDCPHYTRPQSVDGMAVPDVLLSGDHDAIRRWRLKQSLGRTWQRRPDLLARRPLSLEETELLAEFQREASS